MSIQSITPPLASQKNKYLSTWKEIARYFGRGVRTVQRWEECLGMPVRRPHGKSRSAVMAIATELDDWMAGSRLKNGLSAPDNRSLSHGEQEAGSLCVLVMGASGDADEPWDLLRKKLGGRFKLDTARDLDSALKMLEEINDGGRPAPDLVIVDQRFFRANGDQILRRCMASSRLKQAQILVRPSIKVHQERLAA